MLQNLHCILLLNERILTLTNDGWCEVTEDEKVILFEIDGCLRVDFSRLSSS